MPGTPVLPIFESIPDALVIVDQAGNIVMANGNAHSLFGYASGELAGRGRVAVPATPR